MLRHGFVLYAALLAVVGLIGYHFIDLLVAKSRTITFASPFLLLQQQLLLPLCYLGALSLCICYAFSFHFQDLADTRAFARISIAVVLLLFVTTIVNYFAVIESYA